MRLLLILLLFPFAAFGANRTLSDCTGLPAVGSPPTEASPYDLDGCTIIDGDDITGILTGAASRWGSVALRAPSKTLWVVSDYISFDVNNFYFLEDQSRSNTLRVQHKVITTNTPGFWTMWRFNDFNTVKIGGPNLSLTFQGNHPGLANCSSWPNWSSGSNCDQNQGLVEFRMNDGTQATLADFRANIRFSQQYAIYTWGNVDYGASTNKILQLNVAGMFYATSGIFFHQGVRNAWADPDRTVFSDPYVRVFGWTGEAPGPTEYGLKLGCIDQVNDQVRMSSFVGYGVESITGGWTGEYGAAGFVPRNIGAIGSAASPLKIRLKDVSVSGPGTGYEAGVRVKSTVEPLFFKGDPAGDLGFTPSRFVDLIKLPDTYGSGAGGFSLSGCTTGTVNTFSNAAMLMIKLENDQGASTEGYKFRFYGDWRHPTQGGTFSLAEMVRFGSNLDTFPVRKNAAWLSHGVVWPQSTVTLRDQSTISGPGTWVNVLVEDASAIVPGRNSTVTDTNVSGVVTVSANTENTTVLNVNFTGSARAVITVGSGSTATVDDVCVPNGSTITGSGTVTYEGSVRTLPYTIPNGTQNCNVTANARPNPPGL
jgi:hypothetical protein